jgi:hypothetical protein
LLACVACYQPATLVPSGGDGSAAHTCFGDAFAGSQVDTKTWDVMASGGGSASEGGALQLVTPPSSSIALQSKATVSAPVDGGGFQIAVGQLAEPNAYATAVYLSVDPRNVIGIDLHDGVTDLVVLQNNLDPSLVSFPTDPAHRLVRVRRQAAAIFIDTGATAIDFQTRGSAADPFVATDFHIVVEAVNNNTAMGGSAEYGNLETLCP